MGELNDDMNENRMWMRKYAPEQAGLSRYRRKKPSASKAVSFKLPPDLYSVYMDLGGAKGFKQYLANKAEPLKPAVAATTTNTDTNVCMSSQFFEPKTGAGHACVDALKIIFPRRESFTKTQVSQVGYYIKRIGSEKVQEIAHWASGRISIKEGRYGKWLSVCAKHLRESQQEQPAAHRGGFLILEQA